MRTRLVALATVTVALAALTVGATVGGTYGSPSETASYLTHTGSIPSVTGPSIPDAVNTANDGWFVQMALGSSITLAFPSGVNAEPDGSSAPDLVIDVYDSVWPACAFIFGSVDGSTWTSLIPGAPGHPGCPTDSTYDVAIDVHGNYVDPSQPLGAASVTGVADTTNVMIDLDAVGSAVHFVRIDQGAYIAAPHYTSGFDLDSVYLLNSVAPTTTTTAAPTTTTTAAPTTTTTVAPVEGCVYSHGYFKGKGKHLVTALTLGGVPHTAAQVKAALDAGGGKAIAVKRHLIAFLLTPGPHGPIYDGLVSQAHALLAGGPGDASALASVMDQYINTHHC
jgi:hypothetical protein